MHAILSDIIILQDLNVVINKLDYLDCYYNKIRFLKLDDCINTHICSIIDLQTKRKKNYRLQNQLMHAQIFYDPLLGNYYLVMQNKNFITIRNLRDSNKSIKIQQTDDDIYVIGSIKPIYNNQAKLKVLLPYNNKLIVVNTMKLYANTILLTTKNWYTSLFIVLHNISSTLTQNFVLFNSVNMQQHFILSSYYNFIIKFPYVLTKNNLVTFIHPITKAALLHEVNILNLTLIYLNI